MPIHHSFSNSSAYETPNKESEKRRTVCYSAEFGLTVNLTFYILHPSPCSFGVCVSSSLQISKYATCFGPAGHLQVYSFVVDLLR
jgi:hypothetical protein